MTSLWMGNLEPYMDETFVTRAFATMGELAVGVRLIRNKITGSAAGYCFVELEDEATAERCLRKVNGKPLPGATLPKRFKLSRATYGRLGENSPLFSLFVGDLTPEVDDGMLYEFFYNYFPSCRSGKVVLDSKGNSKGCGFVEFPNQRDQKRALVDCQGAVGLGGKPLRLSLAANKANRNEPSNNRPWKPLSQTSNQSQCQYFNQHDHQQYYNYYSGYQSAMNQYNYDQHNYTENVTQECAEVEDGLDDPNPELDVMEANRRFMDESEELYDALIDCYWQPPESWAGVTCRTTCSLPEPILSFEIE